MTTVKGFTLIELIAVIVILGILAAVATPRFVNLQTSANIAVVRGIEGSVRSMANYAYASCQATPNCMGSSYGAVIYLNGLKKNVQVLRGWPDAGELERSDQIDDLVSVSGVNITSQASRTTVRWSIPNKTNCYTQYRQPNNTLGATPTITSVTTGC